MFKRIGYVMFVLLVISTFGMWKVLQDTKHQLSVAKQNETALLSTVKDIEKNGKKIGIENRTLRLSIKQLKSERDDYTKEIKSLNVKLKNVESFSNTQLSVNAELKALLKDTTVVRKDSITQVFVESEYKKIEINQEFLKMQGLISDISFSGKIHIPVTINQTVEAVYKRKFLWWRWKLEGFKQYITTDNPYVDIGYSEYINVGKTKRRKK